MQKRILSLLLTVILSAGLLAGCGGATTSPAADSSAPAAPAQSSAPAASEAPAGDVTIELWLQKTNVVDQFGEIISKFEAANPGIHIDLTSVPDPETALVGRVAANDYPDIITIWPSEKYYRDLMRDGALMDISDQAFLSQVAEGTRKIAQYEGKDYALSVTMSAYGILVNNKIFADNNLQKPATWDELISVCKALQEKGVQPFTFYGKSAEQVGQLGERVVGVINNDITAPMLAVGHKETTWNDQPEMRQLAEALVELHKYGQKDILGAAYDDAFNDFTTEKAAMMIYGSWAVQRLMGMNEALDMEMIPFPNPTGGPSNIPSSIDTALSISESCKEKEAALKFLEYFASTENAQWYADNEKNPPVIKGVTYNVPALQSIQKKLAAGEMFFTPSNFWPAGLRKAWEAPLQALIDPMGPHDVDAFLSATEAICVEYMQNE